MQSYSFLEDSLAFLHFPLWKETKIWDPCAFPQLHSLLFLSAPGSQFLQFLFAPLFSNHDCPSSPAHTPHSPATHPTLTSSLPPRLSETLLPSWLPSIFSKMPPQEGKDQFSGMICQQLPTLYLVSYCFHWKPYLVSHTKHESQGSLQWPARLPLLQTYKSNARPLQLETPFFFFFFLILCLSQSSISASWTRCDPEATYWTSQILNTVYRERCTLQKSFILKWNKFPGGQSKANKRSIYIVEIQG